jgi:diguanylate cyclase (GGDEF)-like protein/PAS domain S-box-containing protein
MRLWPQVFRLSLMAAAYWGVLRLGLFFVSQPEGVAAIWPASGFVLALLMLNPKKQWGQILAVIFVVNAAGNWSGGNTLPASLGFALANVAEACLGAWALTYFCRPNVIFGRVREIFALFGVAVFSNGVTALLGAAVPLMFSNAPFFHAWRLWWVADGLGIMLVTPFIVGMYNSRGLIKSISLPRLFEVIFLGLLVTVFGWLLFGPFTSAENPLLRNYMIFPLLIWMSFRFRQPGMAGALLLFAAIAIWHTEQGHGIFALASQTATQHLISVQIFLSVASFSGLLLNALITGYEEAEEALKASNDFAINLIDSMQDGVSVLDHDGVHMDVNLALCRMTGFSREELIGTGAPHLYWPEEEYEPIQAAFERMLASEGGNFELIFKRKNGERFPVIVSPFSIMDEHGRVLSYSATVKDITERKRAEAIPQKRLEISKFADTHLLDEVLQKTLDEAEALTGSRIGFAHFLEADQKTLMLQMWSTNTLEHMCTAKGKGMYYSLEQAGVWTDCVAAREPVIHNDYPNLAHRKGLPEGHAPILRELVVPIIRNDLIVMIMGVGNKPSEYTDSDVEAISQLANSAWDIIQRKKAEIALEEANTALQTALAREQELARADPLTGIHNRRSLIERAEHELEVAERYQRPLAVMMFDIDHFKKINDTFGHLTGDQILKRVTHSTCGQLRSADVIGRYGGEEFIILLPMTKAEQACSLAERIRENAATIHVPTPKGDASVTLSIGIVELQPAESVEDVFRRADDAMYAAKQAGRNCVKILYRK